MPRKKKLTKGDKKVLEKLFGGDQNMVIKIDKKADMITIITPLVRIRKRGCKSIILKKKTEEEEPVETDPELSDDMIASPNLSEDLEQEAEENT